MIFDTDDIPYIHPLAANMARMFAADFAKRHSLQEDVAQELANELGFVTHLMLTKIESIIDRLIDEDSLTPDETAILKDYAGILKQAVREAIQVNWSDDEDGGEKVRIGPKILA